MLLKKIDRAKNVKLAVVSMVTLIALTGAFKLYHDSKYVKGEYDRICPQNYGDPISLDRCYWSYKFEGQTLDNALKLEVVNLFLIPILIFAASL